MSIQSIQSSLQYHEHQVGEEIQVAFINITATQLKKSIMDATKPVRELLANTGIHDYSTQEQGTHAKVTLEFYYLEDEIVEGRTLIPVSSEKASLYRPTSGNGDPRIWFTNLKKYVEAGDTLAIIVNPYDNNALYVFNADSTAGFEDYLDMRFHRMAMKVGA